MSLDNFSVTLDLPVLWADQDLFGHVNNTIYLKWFESSRVSYWDESGLRTIMEPQNCGPILASVSCDYLKQVNYPDRIQVGARMIELRRTSMILEHEIFSANNDAIAARGSSVVVLFDYTIHQPKRIEHELRSIIAQFEGRCLDD